MSRGSNSYKDGRVGTVLVYSRKSEETHGIELQRERERRVVDKVRKIMKEQIIWDILEQSK